MILKKRRVSELLVICGIHGGRPIYVIRSWGGMEVRCGSIEYHSGDVALAPCNREKAKKNSTESSEVEATSGRTSN